MNTRTARTIREAITDARRGYWVRAGHGIQRGRQTFDSLYRRAWERTADRTERRPPRGPSGASRPGWHA